MDEMTPLRACLGQSTAFVLRMKTSQLHRQRSQPMALPWGKLSSALGPCPVPQTIPVSFLRAGLRCLGEAEVQSSLLLLCSNGASTSAPLLPSPAQLVWDFPSISIQGVSLALGGAWIQTSHPCDHTESTPSSHLVSPFHGERKIIKFSSLLSSSGMRTYVQSIGPECRVRVPTKQKHELM